MNRSTLCLAPLLLVAALPGCSRHSIREGIWRLSFALDRSETGEPFPLPDCDARVRVEWNGSGEVVEIAPINAKGAAGPTKAPPRRKPMYGDIPGGREERDVIIRVNHNDEDWIWQMVGIVRDPYTIDGTRLQARARFDRLTLEGKWRMRWVRDD